MRSRLDESPWSRTAVRVAAHSLGAMLVILGLFRWLVLWYDDIMPNDPPPCFCENAFSLVCSVGMWPFVVSSVILHGDPAVAYWLPLWIVSALFWGVVVEWTRRRMSRQAAGVKQKPTHRFARWAIIQVAVVILGCALWFYFRASNILAHPADPENYGTFGNTWSFQGFAFCMSRLIPIVFGLCLILIAERLVLQLRPSKGLENKSSPQ